MPEHPFFSVVLATFGRGRHIAPTIESVLRQSFDDFELIVVGDACNDETESVVRSFEDKRILWRNLRENCGSQSFPNNEGIRAARGPWIAYLGHDDIWAADHLSTLHAACLRTDSSFVVGGCIYHTPPGTGIHYVTGLFDAVDAAHAVFFPPSALAHRRAIIDQIGPWRDPRAVVPPVDVEFLSRAAAAGLQFVSTQKITVHKFAAGHRYLGYLLPSSAEQREMLEALRAGNGPDVEKIVAAAKQDRTVMAPMVWDREPDHAPGFLFEQNRQNKGLSRPTLSPLLRRTVIRQENDGRALDWHPLKLRLGSRFRWSGPNPRPKILISFTGTRARITLKVRHPGVGDLALQIEDRNIPFQRRTGWAGRQQVIAEIPLKADDYTVLTLEKPTVPLSELYPRKDQRRVGLALGDVVIEPAE